MKNITHSAMSSSELGTLWMIYEIKTLREQMIGIFAKQSKDSKAKKILEYHLKENNKLIEGIKQIFNKEKAVIPDGFDEKDVFLEAPTLFDDIFHIMFLRAFAKISLGINSTQLGMCYRDDILNFYENSLKTVQETYTLCTTYLTDQGVLSKPPYITKPKEVEYIEEKKYMSGVQLLKNKRALNSLEVAYLYQVLEVNVFGMQLMTGFAQVAKESEVKDYFIRGKELAKKFIRKISDILLESDIQPPTTWAGKATDSIIPPFSDKMMMYCTNILASSAIGNASLGMSFSMRSDLPAKLGILIKDTADYAKAGGKLMITHKWLEEPPQMEDRTQIIKGKKSLLPL